MDTKKPPESHHPDLFGNLARLTRGFVDPAEAGPTGPVLRNEGIKQVEEHNPDWMRQCIEAFPRLELPKTFTGEEIRFALNRLLLHPNHPNAYGALINNLVRRKLIQPTGGYRQMTDPTSHARETKVYRRYEAEPPA